MVETQPTWNMSVTSGSSLAAAFWATSMMRRSAAMADSRALMLLGRPTKSGMTMCGNTTTSRNGKSGSSMGVGGNGGCPDIWSAFQGKGDRPAALSPCFCIKPSWRPLGTPAGGVCSRRWSLLRPPLFQHYLNSVTQTWCRSAIVQG